MRPSIAPATADSLFFIHVLQVVSNAPEVSCGHGCAVKWRRPCRAPTGSSVSAFSDPLLDVRQRFFHLIDEDQAQIARIEARQGGIDGEKLTAYFLDDAGALGVASPLRSSASTSPSARPRWHWSW